jgi:hypothetical protein
MDDAPYTDDLDLSAVSTRDDLAALLRTVHVRADKPSLRTLEARTRRSRTPLSKTVVAEMLKGTRFPRKVVMISFVRACGVADDATEPWQRAWERAAANEEALARPPATHTARDRRGTRPRPGAADETRTQNVSADQASGEIDAAAQMEIRRLRDQVSQLAGDNAELRLQLTRKPGIPSVQISPVHDLAATVFMGSHEHAVRYFAMDDDKSRLLFYRDLAKYIHKASETVYILGKGFHHERSSSVYRLLIRSEREALRHGVDMIRIQTGNPVAAGWAKSYAKIMADFPSQFRMMADLDGISYNDVILIDPRGHDPVVSFIFETREPGPLGPVGRPIVALFIINAPKLASNLADQLINHAEDLSPLHPETVRDLASKYIYFAWGVHMASSKIKRDVPDARLLGKAILRKWQRHISGMLSGPADRATIEYTDKDEDSFDGIAYELSWWGKERLDRHEQRAYGKEDVEIELNGQAYQAFTYVPLPEVTEKTQLTHGSWIDLVVEGARENQMTGLLSELLDGGARINDNRL